jgi:hypothetical protein
MTKMTLCRLDRLSRSPSNKYMLFSLVRRELVVEPLLTTPEDPPLESDGAKGESWRPIFFLQKR